MFYRHFGDAVLGCPAQKFTDMKEKAAHFSGVHGSGKTEVSQRILHEMYERLLYKECILEVQVTYMSSVLCNKVQFICNGVNWGRRVDW